MNAYGTQSNDASHIGSTTNEDGNGFHGRRASVHVRPESDTGRSDGPNGKSAHAHVGPSAASYGTNAHGVHSGAPMRVGPILDGNTDTRGLVSPEERVQLQPFGTELRALRKAAGLSQEQLGKLAGIGTTHISRLEQGRRRPSVDAIKALARILAPERTTDAVERRLGALAGDSLREGAARRKRRVDNKHRREAAAEIAKHQAKLGRVIARKEMSGLPVNDSLRNLASLDLTARLRPVEDEPGITGIEPRRTRRDAQEDIRDIIKSMTKRRR